jgi:hypothetical protein
MDTVIFKKYGNDRSIHNVSNKYIKGGEIR